MALCRLEQGSRWERADLRQTLPHGHLTDGRWGAGRPKGQGGLSNQGFQSLELHNSDCEPDPAWHHTRTLLPGRPQWGREGGKSMGCVPSFGFCPALCSHGLCFMVKTTYLNKF